MAAVLCEINADLMESHPKQQAKVSNTMMILAQLAVGKSLPVDFTSWDYFKVLWGFPGGLGNCIMK